MSAKQKSLNYVDLRRPTIFAHRGSSVHAPENTLAAFELALEQGADGIELDVKLSADGHVVVMHDNTVDRTTNGIGPVKSLTLKELMKLDAGSKFPQKFEPQKIPTLEDVFEALGSKLFINIELTNYSSPADELPDKVVAIVQKFHLESMILLSSFNYIALCRARSILHTVPIGLLAFSGTAKLIFQSRLIRFDPLIALHPALKDFTPQLLQTAHKKGTRIHVYTVNQAEDLERLFTAGVDGLFTDDPALAIKVLAGQPSKNP